LRELHLWNASDGLSLTFADVDALAAQCRFRDCQHKDEPGCAVRASIESDELDAERLESKRKLQREQEFLLRKMDPEMRSAEKKRIKISMRGVRDRYQHRDKGKN
jgi:ribosome biogenesis GTPase